jgi:hypothetical protein
MRPWQRADIIERWKALAASDPERRADWGGLVLVFAEAAGHWPVWQQALEGWNVQTSQQVLQWQAGALQRGRAEGKACRNWRVLPRFESCRPMLC